MGRANGSYSDWRRLATVHPCGDDAMRMAVSNIWRRHMKLHLNSSCIALARRRARSRSRPPAFAQIGAARRRRRYRRHRHGDAGRIRKGRPDHHRHLRRADRGPGLYLCARRAAPGSRRRRQPARRRRRADAGPHPRRGSQPHARAARWHRHLQPRPGRDRFLDAADRRHRPHRSPARTAERASTAPTRWPAWST